MEEEEGGMPSLIRGARSAATRIGFSSALPTLPALIHPDSALSAPMFRGI
jgi:hypothetical protein